MTEPQQTAEQLNYQAVFNYMNNRMTQVDANTLRELSFTELIRYICLVETPQDTLFSAVIQQFKNIIARDENGNVHIPVLQLSREVTILAIPFVEGLTISALDNIVIEDDATIVVMDYADSVIRDMNQCDLTLASAPIDVNVLGADIWNALPIRTQDQSRQSWVNFIREFITTTFKIILQHKYKLQISPEEAQQALQLPVNDGTAFWNSLIPRFIALMTEGLGNEVNAGTGTNNDELNQTKSMQQEGGPAPHDPLNTAANAGRTTGLIGNLATNSKPNVATAAAASSGLLGYLGKDFANEGAIPQIKSKQKGGLKRPRPNEDDHFPLQKVLISDPGLKKVIDQMEGFSGKTVIKNLSSGYEKYLEEHRNDFNPVNEAVEGLKMNRNGDKKAYSIPDAIRKTESYQLCMARRRQIQQCRKNMKAPYTDVFDVGLCNYDELGNNTPPDDDNLLRVFTRFGLRSTTNEAGYFSFDFGVLILKDFNTVMHVFNKALDIKSVRPESFKFVEDNAKMYEKVFGSLKSLHSWIHRVQEPGGKIHVLRKIEVTVMFEDPQCKVEVETSRYLVEDFPGEDTKTKIHDSRKIKVNRSYDPSKRSTKDGVNTPKVCYVSKNTESVNKNDKLLTQLRNGPTLHFTTLLLPQVRIWFPPHIKVENLADTRLKIRMTAYCEMYDPSKSEIKDVNALEILNSYEEDLKTRFAQEQQVKRQTAIANKRLRNGPDEEISRSFYESEPKKKKRY